VVTRPRTTHRLQQHANRPIDPTTTSAMLPPRLGHQEGAILPPSMQIDPSVVIAIKPAHSNIDMRIVPHAHAVIHSTLQGSSISVTRTTVWAGVFVIFVSHMMINNGRFNFYVYSGYSIFAGGCHTAKTHHNITTTIKNTIF
jgi:hypothetical protein